MHTTADCVSVIDDIQEGDVMKGYKYHVVYNIPRGWGSIEVDVDKKMNTKFVLEQVRKYISKEHCDGANVVIINWIRLKYGINDLTTDPK